MTRWKARIAAVRNALELRGDTLVNAMLWSERIISFGFWLGRNIVALHFRYWRWWLRGLIRVCDRETAVPPAAILSLVLLLPIPALCYFIEDALSNTFCTAAILIWLLLIVIVNFLITLFGVTVGSFLRSVGEIVWFAELITWIALLFAGRITSIFLLLAAHALNGSSIKDSVIIAANTVFNTPEPNVQEQIYEYVRIELKHIADSAELVKLQVAIKTVVDRNRAELKEADAKLSMAPLEDTLKQFCFNTNKEHITLSNISRACRYAMSTYGHVGLKFLGILPYICTSSALSDADALAYCSTKCGLIKTNFKWGLFRPGYAVWLTDEGRNLVIAIRGTLALQDFVGDLVAKPVEWNLSLGESESPSTYSVHDGMGRSACWLLGRIFETNSGKKAVISPKRFAKIEKIEIFGHSMGAGVAALLCAKLRSLHRERIARKELEVCCIGFGMPAVGCSDLGKELQQSVLSIVHGPDLVPRFSIRSVSRLLTEVLSVWKASSTPPTSSPTQPDIAAYSNPILAPPGTVLFIPEQSTNRATPTTPSAIVVSPHTASYFQDFALIRNAGYNHLPQCYAMMFESVKPGLYDKESHPVSE